ncbi:hypothetical protein [Pseudonocardia abyssalis]|uniref:Uncharacterized protein n=1 Tax=Pseudonocardia abyssalis TaxID=2792008 RepID=A0ABS6UXL9_9PSEU|nr:hypothetical protein [Pseudonocardia abyssalis]MBW0113936.1 hypothetical protein [Pseudonocardia abyssalis]MBW0136980.1 hypothetical protein [Pseudonocardia abyssalis]
MSTEPDDTALLDELAALLGPQHEPPPEVLHAARATFTWRTVDAEIAALTYDSLLDDAPVGVRASAQPRILTFEAGALTIEVELVTAPAGRRMLGQLVPAQEAELELLGDGEVLFTGSADALGRFSVQLTREPRRVTLRCRTAAGATAESASTVL